MIYFIITTHKESFMPKNSIPLPHVCPKCKKTIAHTTQELIDLFGLRQMDEKSLRSQSRCKKCRGIK